MMLCEMSLFVFKVHQVLQIGVVDMKSLLFVFWTFVTHIEFVINFKFVNKMKIAILILVSLSCSTFLPLHESTNAVGLQNYYIFDNRCTLVTSSWGFGLSNVGVVMVLVTQTMNT